MPSPGRVNTPDVAREWADQADLRTPQIQGAALALGGVVGLEAGAAVATRLIDRVGITATVSLRLGFGAILLLAITRPRLRRLDRRAAGGVALVAALLVVHHILFYAAIHRLPLGIAVTLEFVGPLLMALIASRRPAHLGWAMVAAVGVVLCAGVVAGDPVPLTGALLALLAGGCWAGYIGVFPLVAARIGRRDALALATAAAGLVVVPFGIADGRIFTARALLMGLAVAVVCDVLSYTLQAEALVRLSRRVFSIVTCTEPAAGAIIGAIALGQRITALQWTGILAVAAAAAAVAVTPEPAGG